MKALKEKRVSLRSLFRRSLVILSLLALAFASCNDSGGSSGETQPTNGTQPPTTPPKAALTTVLTMTVVKHPYMPSFEGAYPDLTGLEVLVKWTDGAQELVKDPTKFTVYPPVAYVKTAGMHIKDFSKRDEYTIQYIGDEGIYDLNKYRVNVYIPAVLALDPDRFDDEFLADRPSVVGTLDEVYEDVGIREHSLKFRAHYVAFGFIDATDLFDDAEGDNGIDFSDPYDSGDCYGGADYGTAAADVVNWDIPPDSNWYANPKDSTVAGKLRALYANGDFDRDKYDIAKDYAEDNGGHPEDYYKVKPFRWPNFDADSFQSNPITVNPEAWRIDLREKDLFGDWKETATYFAGLKGPSNGALDREVKIGTFYWVDRLKYVSGIERVPAFAADDEDLGYIGDFRYWLDNYKNTGALLTSDRRDNPATDLGAANSAERQDRVAAAKKVQEAWWKALNEANLDFQVIYYVKDQKSTTAQKTRDIKMSDYVRAMYLTDQYNVPRASMPTMNQHDDMGDWGPSAIDAVIEGYDLSMSLFYYSPFIEGQIGQGYIGPDVYEATNAAIIPLDGLIGVYTGMVKERKDGTEHQGEPQVLGAKSNNKQRLKSFYDDVRTYYDVYWVYDNPKGGEPIKRKLTDDDWPDLAGRVWPTLADTAELAQYPTSHNATVGITDFEHDLVEGSESEQRTATITFQGPPSAEYDEFDMEFDYIMQP